MIRTVILDDELPAVRILTKFVKRVPFLKLELATKNPLEALNFMSSHSVDLLLVDIQMPDISGIDLIKKLENRPIIVFTTAYEEYAVEGFDLEVADYLLKPIRFERFLKAASRAQKLCHTINLETPDTSITVKSEYKTVKILVNDILYIEGLKDYVKIHTTSSTILTRLNIKNTQSLLPENLFLRVHRSYVVSLLKIDAIQKEKIQIGKTILPIGETYKDAVRMVLG